MKLSFVKPTTASKRQLIKLNTKNIEKKTFIKKIYKKYKKKIYR